MKRLSLVAMLMAVSAALFAQFGFPGSPFPPGRRADVGPYVKAEVGAIQSDLGTTKLGDLDVAALLLVRDRLGVAKQKDEYVQRSGLHSFLLPGLGQLEQSDAASGIAFLAADVAVLTGTVIFAYSVLPADLHFDRLNYFGSDFSTVNSTWANHSFTDYLPMIGVLFGGMVIDQTIRHWSAADARRGAARAIDAGRTTFTPRIGPGVMGFEITY